MSIFLMLLASQAAAAGVPPSEVQVFLDAEQKAFFSGNCDEVSRYWASDFTMVVEGQRRASNRTELIALCRNVMKMVAAGQIPAGAEGPRVTARDLYMLSDDIAYEVVERLTPSGGRSSVTKVILRQADGWKIAHMHEAIVKAPANE
jgi:hypothetical protein